MPFNYSFDPSETIGGQSKVRDNQTQIDRLEFDIQRLFMITESLWALLKEQHGYSDEELVKRVYEIDAADGALDGRKASAPAKDCPHCQRKLPRKRPRCLYCGNIVSQDLFAV